MTPEEAAELRSAAMKVMKFVFNTLREPLAPDDEVKNWPIAIDFYGLIYCADDTCPLETESSIIADYMEDTTFTLNDLYDAVAQHISNRRDKENEDE